MSKYVLTTTDENGVKQEHPVDFETKVLIRIVFFLYKLGNFLFGEERFNEALKEEGLTWRKVE